MLNVAFFSVLPLRARARGKVRPVFPTPEAVSDPYPWLRCARCSTARSLPPFRAKKTTRPRPCVSRQSVSYGCKVGCSICCSPFFAVYEDILTPPLPLPYKGGECLRVGIFILRLSRYIKLNTLVAKVAFFCYMCKWYAHARANGASVAPERSARRRPTKRSSATNGASVEKGCVLKVFP